MENQYKQTIDKLKLQKAGIGELANVDPSEVSRWLRRPTLLTLSKACRVRWAIVVLADLVQTELPKLPGFCVDYKNTDSLRQLVSQHWVGLQQRFRNTNVGAVLGSSRTTNQ
jgi:hypothetical protein